ncbi:M20/M25/M40 family metallo-hydrolase [Candidatus Bathyarchaeota archaeon]|nr:M20/M25/M40 family metallo-hydrolase [Candidatus Bathyarchaeota archaeon]
MVNIVASFDCGSNGKHLVLNGHIDVYPVGDPDKWVHDPWGGEIVDGKIFGRGSNDMKAGTTASIFTYYYLSRIREQLNGKLTLTCVSDEETFGPWGARYLINHYPEVLGDTLLNGEPCAHQIRFGEKGILWLKFTINTKGAHGAYEHASPSATKIASELMLELDDTIKSIETLPPENVRVALQEAKEIIEDGYGTGAFEVLQRTTINFGTVHGGLKVNMIPGTVVIEADIRLPVGQTKNQVLEAVDSVVKDYPNVSYEEINYTPPSHCDPDGEMVDILKRNVELVEGQTPKALIAMGGTDARLWRYKGIPAYVYGPYAKGMGSTDDYVEVDEFIDIVKVHVLSAYEYLKQGN